ncbi:ATP-dependent Clp protease ATP-binding subunit ClpE [Apilactobacillus kunkeei]|uniref:ATP-dependent Clp protease ATP-binding subunit n=1 Tax=Apilactobacillus kunkeei TaxID=148814 RepID=UPI001C6F9A54|nr:ATP-dependent Clp protease ATP-binding subunit [Apilactobacillus kunkeei]MBX8455813.1 ATP-dependent Clp protease ATP-binding subunit [Apilactobacillus kunkeei]QYU54006.1 ATP-dependent Clp protease ATP-binding subunit [Apilactobacillus kunkeei]CAI2620503.1 ATP-dependent Clp protease ATP-binding subunit ClpE [Apilactobacillus kunkeei]CAI2620888.1 ATP-dependent Clp protease ATP-binding subunit ClpE [Apilactobacillus kunkeei]CAI2621866.1 ATP-dependent Clp protease ATP-binding subunit ClpE [Apil
MKCENCHINEATIHLLVNFNGEKRHIDICQDCYQKLSQQSEQYRNNGGVDMMNDPFGFSSLDDLFNAMNQSNQNSIRRPENNQQKNNNNSNSNSVLEKYGYDLTDLARKNKIDPVIGRDKEIDRVIEILNRRTKNNPVLIGEAGVGKTAVVEGLALKIAHHEVPDKLKNKRVIRLDVVSIVQGTSMRGQFEQRMQELIKEVQSNKNIILFIDEIHEIMGAGNADGAMDAGNVLKPALARGSFQLIGATTLNEYRGIEKDSALARRFQTVQVDEPSLKQALHILNGIKGRYEKYHHVKYSDDAIKAAVYLSNRYIQDRFLPDKAIDLIDEAGSKLNIKSDVKSPDDLKEELSKCESEKKDALQKEDYEKAAFYRDKIEELNYKLKDFDESDNTYPTVSTKDIEGIIESITKIPVGQLQEQEQDNLKDLDKKLAGSVIGQNQAIEKVARAIKRNRIGFNGTGRPIGSFLFVGTTGIGKTELAKQLAKQLFGSKEAMIRFDMSEYREPHSISKLIGSPPGYVGYDEAGQLTEKVRRNPYSLILFDEIEKAHPDVLHAFLQILDDGRLTDSKGRTVSFKDTVIIMTSNAGTGASTASVGFGAEANNKTHSVLNKLGDYFKPEFLNRFDDIVEFNQLSKDDLKKIVSLMLENVNKMLKNRGITIDVSDAAKDKLVEKGYNPEMGARPLRRVIQEEVEDKVADYYLNNPSSKHLSVEVNDENKVFVNAK